MEKQLMCRICLVTDVRMCLIGDTHLQYVFEALTLVPFKTQDNRPLSVCYICRASLENSYRLREQCLRSEELFTQMVEKMCSIQEASCTPRLTLKHPLIQLSTGGAPEASFYKYEVKTEPKDPDVSSSITLQRQNGSGKEYSQPSTSEESFSVAIKAELEDDTSAVVAEELTTTEQRGCDKLTTSKHKRRSISTGKKPYQCNICYKNFKRRTTLKVHKCKPPYNQPCECSICNKYFSCQSNLRRHIRSTHSSELLHQCKVCSKRFVRKDHLDNHSRIHSGEKPYQCDICKTYFRLKASLSDHIRAHADEKLYQCHLCQKCFNYKGNLNRHIRTHKGDKPYQCEVCNKSFSRSGHLYVHMRVHTGEKPFKCNSCDMCFCKESNLNLHVIHKHSSERRFQCNVCNRSFNHRGNYNGHVRLHSSDRPYQCDVCNKWFGHEDILKKHYIKKHTG